MERNDNLVDKIAGWSVAIIAITRSLAVMHGDTTLGGSTITKALLLLNYACLFCLFPCVVLRKTSNLTAAISLVFCITFYLLLSFLNSYKNDASFNVVLFAILMCFCFTNNIVRLYAFRIFRVFVVLSSLLGIVAFLSYVLSLGIPFRVVPYYDRIDTSYIDYGFAYLTMKLFSVRLCGLFNEPGYFGTMLALFLIADHVNLRRIENIVLLIAGILTFSLAFFILVIIALVYKGFHSKRGVLIIVLFAVALAVALPNLADKYPEIEALIMRFTFEDGEWVGDNRTTDVVDITFKQMINNGDKLFLGFGSGYTNYLDETGTSSYKGFIIDFGLMGSFLIWGLLLVSSLLTIKPLNDKKYRYFFLLCFFMSIYQRPYVVAITYLVVLLGGVLFCDSNNSIRENKTIKA